LVAVLAIDPVLFALATREETDFPEVEEAEGDEEFDIKADTERPCEGFVGLL
jgi:hypothetical protein